MGFYYSSRHRFLLYRRLVLGKYRAGLSAKLTGRVPRRQSQSHCVWFHAVSVGEVKLLRPVVDEILSA